MMVDECEIMRVDSQLDAAPGAASSQLLSTLTLARSGVLGQNGREGIFC